MGKRLTRDHQKHRTCHEKRTAAELLSRPPAQDPRAFPSRCKACLEDLLPPHVLPRAPCLFVLEGVLIPANTCMRFFSAAQGLRTETLHSQVGIFRETSRICPGLPPAGAGATRHIMNIKRVGDCSSGKLHLCWALCVSSFLPSFRST